MKKIYYKLFLFFFIFSQFGILFLTFPKEADSGALTTASATLGNSRLSYEAGVTSGSAGASTVNIDASGNPDNNTNHLFPKDTICFANAGELGCSLQTTYTVNSIVDSDTLQLTSILGENLSGSDLVIASQSGSLTLTFTTSAVIPDGGDIFISIPHADNANGNDGFPDSGGSVAASGFDMNGIVSDDIVVSGDCTNWNATETITAQTSGTSDHTIQIDKETAECAASSDITVTIDSSPGIVNPAPLTSGHSQGTADVYSINIKTRDAGGNTLDEVDVAVAPVEAVLVSATINESMTFVVAGVNTSTSVCGQTTDVTTTAYSVPWGAIASTSTFYEAAQLLTVTTNSDGGYNVKIEENDQMGKDGTRCDSPAEATADETDNPPCIKDTVCDDTCTHATSKEWVTTSNYGLGYSLANNTGADAAFLYNESSRTFSAKQIADQYASEARETIMLNTGAVSTKSVHVCYRISVSGTQPPGYYFNKVKYTATPIF